jgi:hypothetical protein
VLTQKGEGKMKRNKMIRVVTMFVIAFFAFGLFTNSTHALVFPRSSNVAMVPNNASNNGGDLYVGSSWPDSPGFTFTNLSPVAIADGTQPDPITAGSYDTVVLMLMDFNFATYWADSDFSSRILNFVNGGGKLILYTSESSVASFSTFVYPFTVDTPGQTGSSGGTLVNIADDTLSSSNTSDASYIDLALIVSQTDAVGDLNVMTSLDSHWYIDMTGINVNNVGGPAHTYAFYGAGLIIFNGLDIDYTMYSSGPSNANGYDAINMIWWRELCGQTLGPGQSVSGLTLTPATATNDVGVMHTVTALVKDTINNPIPSVVVNFTIISGPNAGLVGSATTDSNGEATFSWTSLAVGTDTVQASVVNAAGAPVTTTATKDWVIPSNVIPEVPFGTIAGLAAMCVALVGFAARGKIRKLF